MARNKRTGSQRIALACTVVLACAASPAWATFHLWDASEVYSNADGTIQFVELVTSFDNQHLMAGHYYGSNEHGITFPIDERSCFNNAGLSNSRSNLPPTAALTAASRGS